MGQAASPWWVELLRALPSIVTAGTAIFGVFLAKAGLERLGYRLNGTQVMITKLRRRLSRVRAG